MCIYFILPRTVEMLHKTNATVFVLLLDAHIVYQYSLPLV